ncbi:MAG TPA: sugar transferase, partial [Ktedonobacteraceae bacterium]|nr:sugar transferase [Ktedonobacteraceae bacterium]
MKSSEVTPIQQRVEVNRQGVLEAGSTGPITKAISRRRLQRYQWRIFEFFSLIILDALLINTAFLIAYTMRYTVLRDNPIVNTIHNNLFGNPGEFTPVPLSSFAPLQTSIVIGLIVIFAVRRLYTIRLTGSWFRQAWTIISSSTIGLAFLITYFFAYQPPANSRLLVPFVWAASIIVLCLGRLIVSSAMVLLYRLGLGETRLLVVGSGRLGKMIMQHITASPNLGYSIVGFLHDMSEPPSDFGRFKMLGAIEDLGLVIRSMQVDEVIIALPANMHYQAIRSVRMCERLGTSFKLIPDLYEVSLSRINMEAIEGIPLLNIKQASLNTIGRLVTRFVDVAGSILFLLLSSPLWLCLGLAIRLTSSGPIIYKQIRIGRDGKPFSMYKFRSMYKDADQRLAALLANNEAQGPLFKMKADPRITPIGKFLRRNSMDELPQFINILKGEMSLVGPRPPLPREVAQYEEWQKGRLAIKPGLTGLWQVRGRSDLTFDEGVLMD